MNNINKFVNFLFFIISLIFIIFILLGEVKAQTFNGMIWSNINTPFQGNNTSNNFNIVGTLPSNIRNKGAGTISFILSLEGKYKVYGISLLLNDTYQCSFGSTMGYNDSSAQVYTYSVVCPVNNTSSGQNRYAIEVSGYAWNNIHYWTTSPYMTFSDYGSSTDYSSVLGSINSNVAEMGRYIQYTNTDIYNIRTILESSLNSIKSDNQQLITNIQNQTQQQHEDSEAINQSIQDTNNTLKDSSIDSNNTSSSTTEWNNKNASNGTITNLLTLPIQLLKGYVNGMNSSCSPFNLGNLFGTTIILPCINVGNLIGSSLWSVIDVLFSGFMIFGIAKKLIKIFNDFTNMKSNQVDELYGGGA